MPVGITSLNDEVGGSSPSIPPYLEIRMRNVAQWLEHENISAQTCRCFQIFIFGECRLGIHG